MGKTKTIVESGEREKLTLAMFVPWMWYVPQRDSASNVITHTLKTAFRKEHKVVDYSPNPTLCHTSRWEAPMGPCSLRPGAQVASGLSGVRFQTYVRSAEGINHTLSIWLGTQLTQRYSHIED